MNRFAIPALLLLPLCIGQLFARSGLMERRNEERIRQAGFADIELDRLHQDIARAIRDLRSLARPLSDPAEPQARATDPEKGQVTSPSAEDAAELLPSIRRSFMTGQDRQGRTYYRLRIDEGMHHTIEPTPDRFLLKSHAYVYFDEEDRLSEIILQFYKLRFTGSQYIREIRRIRHTGPFTPEAPLSAMQIEFRSYDGALPATDLAADDVPLPVLSSPPQVRTVLHDPENPMPFDKQARIVETYRHLLRRLHRQLSRKSEALRLQRNFDLEKAIDFTGTAF